MEFVNTAFTFFTGCSQGVTYSIYIYWVPWDQIANIHWIIEKAREFQRNIYFCFTDYAKTFDYVNKLWKIHSVA